MRDRPRCPVCSAPMRGATVCTRCGADLSPSIRVMLRAWDARRRAREALLRGDVREAAALASASQRLHATRAGRGIGLLARWLCDERARMAE